MTNPDMQHRTTTMERTFKAGVPAAFNAWENLEKRSAWNSPSDDVEIRYSKADFSQGGRDVCECLVGEDVVAQVTADYHEIVADRRIIFTETISAGGEMQGASLVSVGFEAKGSGTRMTVTLQTVAVGGSELLDDVAAGWTSALARMERLLAS